MGRPAQDLVNNTYFGGEYDTLATAASAGDSALGTATDAMDSYYDDIYMGDQGW